MRIMPEHYTVGKLLSGWLAHFLVSFAITVGWAIPWTAEEGARVAVAFYTFREYEQYRSRRKKAKTEIWPKTILDVVFSALGGLAGWWALT